MSPSVASRAYIVATQSFAPTSPDVIHFEEWASWQRVGLVAQLRVSPLDYPFLDQVVAHLQTGPLYTSCLLYNARRRRMR